MRARQYVISANDQIVARGEYHLRPATPFGGGGGDGTRLVQVGGGAVEALLLEDARLVKGLIEFIARPIVIRGQGAIGRGRRRGGAPPRGFRRGTPRKPLVEHLVQIRGDPTFAAAAHLVLVVRVVALGWA